MRVRVKICGVTSAAAACAAAEAGADAIGFVFAESPRRIGVERAAEIAACLPPFVACVAVFRYPAPSEVGETVRRLRPTLVQSEPVAGLRETLVAGVGFLPVFHDGDDLVERVAAHGPPAALLLEAAGRGGRAVAPDRVRAAAIAARTRLVLAGGLTPENVAEAIRQVRPFAVDVSSGVESAPGTKDPERIRRFVDAVRRVSLEIAAAGDPR